jgi:hypothetical protein
MFPEHASKIYYPRHINQQVVDKRFEENYITNIISHNHLPQGQ